MSICIGKAYYYRTRSIENDPVCVHTTRWLIQGVPKHLTGFYRVEMNQRIETLLQLKRKTPYFDPKECSKIIVNH